MIQQFRRFTATLGGRVVSSIVALALVGFAVYSVRSFLAGDTPEDVSYTTYIDTSTGKPFRHRNALGETQPIRAPSGKDTGLPAQPCYWTADGGVKKDPDWVLLNSEVGRAEPTFCPYCHRLVVDHNPPPGPGVKPPPTQADYEAAHH